MDEHTKTRSIPISTEQVWEAYQEVRKHGNSAGVDSVTLAAYEENKVDELYKVWNRMSSGSYFPPAVRETEISKSNGKTRKLGIPTVNDRVAQTLVKRCLEPLVDRHFHKNSFGYRPNRSAHQAIHQATSQCYQKAWVLDLDIEGFFDNLDHGLLMQMLEYYHPAKWMLLYIERWLKAPIEKPDGSLAYPGKGTPQGGVVSPLLSNVYLHHTFDNWMSIYYKEIEFERYADDIIIHCGSKAEAEHLLTVIKERFQQFGLRLHPEKTKIVYCKNDPDQRGDDASSFDFLGITFKPYRAQNRKTGEIFTGFGPQKISKKKKREILAKIEAIKIPRRTTCDLPTLAIELHSHLTGWTNSYYGTVSLRLLRPVFQLLNDRLVRWVQNRHKRFGRSKWKARLWLREIAQDFPNLFVHWKYGFTP